VEIDLRIIPRHKCIPLNMFQMRCFFSQWNFVHDASFSSFSELVSFDLSLASFLRFSRLPMSRIVQVRNLILALDFLYRIRGDSRHFIERIPCARTVKTIKLTKSFKKINMKEN
jgi:hypothetical protein